MTEPQAEGQREVPLRRRIGKIVLAIGLFVIVLVIVFGIFASLVSAYEGSTELVRVYDVIAYPCFVFGIILVMGGFVAIILPEGPSKDGVWVFKTGPFK
ncbi:MAG: hypothetical protein ACXAC0_06215 [Candidatus Thorarchaeota archaeon]|jgi:hypothetical protein